MKLLVALSRTLVGVLFIFSGLIKLNDPVGFSFKLEEYFAPDVLNLTFLEPIALPLAIFLVILEVVLGVALLIGYRPKFTIWALFALIVFFTFLTFYSAYFNKVTDCGCFGDAIPLTPWQSFTKDLILLILILVLLLGQKHVGAWLKTSWHVGALAVSIALCGAFGYHVLNHLPVKDFRPYAEGKSIIDGMKHAEELGLEGPVYENIYTLQHKDGSQQVEISSTQYMEEKWWEKTEWVMVEELSRSVKVRDGYEPPVHDFSISTSYGDITDSVLAADDYILIISYKLAKSNQEAFAKLAKIAWDLEASGLPVLALTATGGHESEAYKHEIQAPFEFGSMDETTLKTIIRSNPGVVWLKRGTVYKKWHYNDVVDADQLKSAR